jgi:hypothetical protein
MKKILFIMAFAALAFNSFSQDYLVLKDGEKVSVIILHVAGDYVRYRLFDDRTGKMYVKDISQISKLIFQNGTVKIYSEATTQETADWDNRSFRNRQNENNNPVRTQTEAETSPSPPPPIQVHPQPPVQTQTPIQSQECDSLFLADGKIKAAIILEITPELVKYRGFGNPAGPLYSVYKSDVEKIIFQSGEEEMFVGAARRNSNNRPLDNQPKVTPPPKSLPVQFGVRGGMNFSTFSGLDKTLDLINEARRLDLKGENKTAFHAGFICRIDLSQNRFSLQPELLLSLQGDKGTERGEPRADDLYYLQLPVYLVYQMTVMPGWDILLGAGLYGAYGIYGNEDAFDAKFNRLDYGFSFMGGFQFGKIQLTGACDLGKNKASDGESWGELTQGIDGIPALYTRNLKISLGYFF